MKKEFITAFLALVAQLLGIVTVLAFIGLLYGAADAGRILLFVAPLFAITFYITSKRNGGFSWLFAWFWPSS